VPFAATSYVKRLMPVRLPPGRLRLATSPTRTASLTAENTTGIVCVAALAANAAGGPPAVNSTATRRSTSSAASALNRSYRPSAHRNAIKRFCPSINPASRRPRRNAATRSLDSLGERLLRNPITGIAGCCARAASGHAAAPPSSEMNSRRLMSDIGFPLALAPRSVFRTLNLPQRGRQVLGADLNRSESTWGAGDPSCAASER
jgi:hypothetical protein